MSRGIISTAYKVKVNGEEWFIVSSDSKDPDWKLETIEGEKFLSLSCYGRKEQTPPNEASINIETEDGWTFCSHGELESVESFGYMPFQIKLTYKLDYAEFR